MTKAKLDFEAAKRRAHRLLECAGMTEGAINSSNCLLALLKQNEDFKKTLNYVGHTCMNFEICPERDLMIKAARAVLEKHKEKV